MSTEQRVFAHWKAMKSWCRLEFVTDRIVDHYVDGRPFPHRYGHYELRMPNEMWLHLARVHKMPVRQVKDIVTAERERRRELR